MTNVGKTVLLVQSSLFQAQIWKLALDSQGIKLFAESPDTDLARTIDDMDATGQPIPNAILIDIGIKGVFNPYEFYRWCSARHPNIKIVLTNSAQIDIPAFEYEWARLKDPQDILPGFQTNNLIPSAMANVNYVLAVMKGAPLQEEALSRKLLPIARKLAEQPSIVSPKTVNEPERSPTIAPVITPTIAPVIETPARQLTHGTMNPTRFMVIASAILLIAPLGYGAWRLYANVTAKPSHPIATSRIDSKDIVQTLTQHTGPVFSVITSSDGQTLISGSGDKTINVWDLPTGQLRQTLVGHTAPVATLALSSDGKTLGSGGRDQAIKLWNFSTGQLLRSFVGGEGWVKSVAFSPDGQTLASGNNDKTVAVWDVTTGTQRYLLTGHTEDLETVAFTPDGQTLASSSGDQTIKLWNLKTGALLHTLQGHAHEVEGMTISPDGLSLVSGDEEDIREWNILTGKLLRIFPKVAGSVRCLAISPDRKWLASGHTNNTVKLWNFKTAEVVQTFSDHADWILSVTFDATGKKLISGSRDQTIKIWPLP